MIDLLLSASAIGFLACSLQVCNVSSYEDRGLRYMNPPAPIQYTQTQPYHGTKRSAPNDEIESSSNISTEFKKLRLNNTAPASVLPINRNVEEDVDRPNGVVPSSSLRQYPATPILPPIDSNRLSNYHASDSNESMTIDETPNRVYINDLDREIAEIEAAESLYGGANGSFFLPDVDKNISKIPLNVLRQKFDAASSAPGSSTAANEQALVLYRDPSSISVPAEEDAVRKAIIAARREAREKMKKDHESQMADAAKPVGTDVTFSGKMDEDQDEDCMDIG